MESRADFSTEILSWWVLGRMDRVNRCDQLFVHLSVNKQTLFETYFYLNCECKYYICTR